MKDLLLSAIDLTLRTPDNLTRNDESGAIKKDFDYEHLAIKNTITVNTPVW